MLAIRLAEAAAASTDLRSIERDALRNLVAGHSDSTTSSPPGGGSACTHVAVGSGRWPGANRRNFCATKTIIRKLLFS